MGDLVVLLHGFGSHHRENWVETGVVAGLLAAGRRVVAPDARGHGASARPHDPAAYAGNVMVGDARALLDHLGVTERRSVDVVGYSMGSVVAARWVPEDERVRSVVLGGVGVNIANGARLADQGPRRPGPAGRGPRHARPAGPGHAPGPGRQGQRPGRAGRPRHRGQDDPTPRHLAGMGVPALVLTGDADWLVGSPGDLAAMIPGADCRTLPGDHLTACASPEFPAAIVDFVTPSAPTHPSEDPAP